MPPEEPTTNPPDFGNPKSSRASNPQPTTDLKRIHTYQSDVEELLQRQQVSKAGIAMAEDKRRVEEAKKPESPPSPAAPTSKVFQISSAVPLTAHWNVKLIVAAAVAVLVLGGIGVGSFLLWNENEPPTIEPQKTRVPEVSAVLLQGGERRAGAIAAIRKSIENVSVPQTELRTLPLKRDDVEMSTAELLTLLETRAPTSLVRVLGNKPTLGVYGFQGGQPFLLFSVTTYDYAFPGMLEWEPKLIDDIGPLFGLVPRGVLSDVGSTTDDALQNIITMKDVIIRNKDARAAFGPGGDIVFLYAFIDKQTLVFATNEDTLKMLGAKAGGGRRR